MKAPQRETARTSRFEYLKGVIRAGLKTTFEVGAALMEIREQKLYQLEFPTFEAFCEAEFQIVRSRAYQLMQAAEVKASLTDDLSTTVDILENERQARELGKVARIDRVDVLETVAKTGPVTSKRIAEVAKQKTTAAAPITLDKTGYPIPALVLPDWERAEARGRELLGQLREVYREIDAAITKPEKSRQPRDRIWAAIPNTVLEELDHAVALLKALIPYAVCTSCEGHHRDQCNLCKRRGYLDKFAWDRYVLPEIKAVRAKAGRKQ
jgi:hypothetical protein